MNNSNSFLAKTIGDKNKYSFPPSIHQSKSIEHDNFWSISSPPLNDMDILKDNCFLEA